MPESTNPRITLPRAGKVFSCLQASPGHEERRRYPGARRCPFSSRLHERTRTQNDYEQNEDNERECGAAHSAIAGTAAADSSNTVAHTITTLPGIVMRRSHP